MVATSGSLEKTRLRAGRPRPNGPAFFETLHVCQCLGGPGYAPRTKSVVFATDSARDFWYRRRAVPLQFARMRLRPSMIHPRRRAASRKARTSSARPLSLSRVTRATISPRVWVPLHSWRIAAALSFNCTDPLGESRVCSLPEGALCNWCPAASLIVRRGDAVLPFMPWLRHTRVKADALGQKPARLDLPSALSRASDHAHVACCRDT
jgi:hypothetical protein